MEDHKLVQESQLKEMQGQVQKMGNLKKALEVYNFTYYMLIDVSVLENELHVDIYIHLYVHVHVNVIHTLTCPGQK